MEEFFMYDEFKKATLNIKQGRILFKTGTMTSLKVSDVSW